MLNGEGDENSKKSIDLISKKKKNHFARAALIGRALGGSTVLDLPRYSIHCHCFS